MIERGARTRQEMVGNVCQPPGNKLIYEEAKSLTEIVLMGRIEPGRRQLVKSNDKNWYVFSIAKLIAELPLVFLIVQGVKKI